MRSIIFFLAAFLPTALIQGQSNQPALPREEDLPTRRMTVVLQLDRPSVKTGAFWFHVQVEGKPKSHFQTGIGNWFPRARVTNHATLPISAGGWHFATGVQDGVIPKRDLESFQHHVFIADRPVFHQADGKNKERVLHIALSTDVVRPGSLIQVQWKKWEKGLAPLAAGKLTASYQQSPALADDEAAWKPLAVLQGKGGEQALEVPKSLNEGLAWLRIGLTDDKGK
jgi:hypothetical protein